MNENISVFIIEDDPVTALDLSEIVEGEGYTTLIFNSYEKAIVGLLSYSPTLLICDINLGSDKNGIDFAIYASKKNPYVGVVFITADRNESYFKLTSTCNTLNYIIKPWTEIQIRNAIKIAMKNIERQSSTRKTLSNLKSKINTLEWTTTIALHDLQSPLNFIKTMMDSAKNEPFKKVTTGEELSLINTLSDTSLNAVNLSLDILSWLKLNRNEFKLNLKPIDINRVILKTIAYYQQDLEFKKNRLTLLLDATSQVLTDESLIEIIIRNIVNNANKHNYESDITIQTKSNSGNITLTIEDNGDGFNLEYLNRENQKSNDYNNTKKGLGLKIIEDLCQLLSIKYSINSQPSIGTTYALLFERNTTDT